MGVGVIPGALSFYVGDGHAFTWHKGASRTGPTLATLNEVGGLQLAGNPSFNAAALVPKQEVTGSRGGNAALTSLLSTLATIGLVTNSSTA